MAVSSYWKKGYLPIAKDEEENFLMVLLEDGTEKELVYWNGDEGVMEELDENFGLFMEGLRDAMLGKKIEYCEGMGLISVA